MLEKIQETANYIKNKTAFEPEIKNYFRYRFRRLGAGDRNRIRAFI